jgi:hypothetical protein
MELIERYLQAIGRHLPPKQRADILSELRSSLVDDLEARAGDQPKQSDVVALLKAMGPPDKVAASYHPEGQYLIGPALYPIFRMVLGIVLFAVIGAQLLAVLIALALRDQPISVLDSIWGIFNSLPAALGFVVLVFALLQWFDVRPELDEEPFDPLALPALADDEPVKAGEQAISVIVGVVVLVLLSKFVFDGGFSIRYGEWIFTDPVIDRLFFWIALSMAFGIVVDIVLLWRRRWQIGTRLLKIGANLFSLAVLALLVQGHSVWLAEAGAGGFFESLAHLSENIGANSQLVGMSALRMAFTVAFVAIGIDTLVQVFRLLKGLIRPAAIIRPSRTS